jgi:hypothetical protein
MMNLAKEEDGDGDLIGTGSHTDCEDDNHMINQSRHVPERRSRGCSRKKSPSRLSRPGLFKRHELVKGWRRGGATNLMGNSWGK